jgi:hypothetical protein
MHSWAKLGCAVLFAVVSGTSAHAQAFAFTNGTLAANNCKAASAPERAEAVALAQAALSRAPHPMVHVHTEGTLPHKGTRDESLQAERDWPAARDLAVGYCVTGNAIYLAHADAILDAWLKTYQLNFNPIDETGLDQLFLAADILDNAMPPALFAQWQAFAAKMSAGYLVQIDKNANKAENWQSHRIKLAAMASYVTADTGAIGHAESAFTTQLDGNIHSNGEVADYGKRDALHYVVYDLEPLTMAALAAHDHGENWYGIVAPGGATLPSALQWLSAYATGAQTHQEFNNSHVAFDMDRRNAGEPGFSGTWSPQTSASLYLYASALDRQWGDLAYKLGGMPKLWQRLQMGMS